MKTYLVGGAVRDRLLGRPVTERDWVVVGATPEVLRDQGFRPVGRDFPVFLHPETNEEYALARTERKTAPGHTGFAFHAAPDVTLEDDLVRRDLTINAMAEDERGALADPFGGRDDLDARILRHVSAAFVEDPLRVLRVARFAARLAPLGFQVAPETLTLMRTMARGGELDTLTPERVWQELVKALASAAPLRFFEVLAAAEALAPLFPLLAARWDAERVHPAFRALQAGGEDPGLVGERWVALVAGAARDQRAPPATDAPDDEAGGRARACCEALRTPRLERDVAAAVATWFAPLARMPDAVPAALLDAAEATGAARGGERWRLVRRATSRLLAVLDPGARGRTDRGLDGLPAALAVDARSWAEAGLPGAEIGQKVREERLRRLAALQRRTVGETG